MYLYDNAIVQNIQQWIGNTVKIVPPDMAFSIYSEEQGDKLTLPLVSLSRLPMRLLQITKNPRTFDGYKLFTNEQVSIKLLSIPIELHYQLDLFGKTQIQCDNMVREFVFRIINVPKMEMTIPYNPEVNITHSFNLSLGEEIADNSDIIEHINKGQYFRQTLDLFVKDAYLWNIVTKKNTAFNLRESDIYLINPEIKLIEKE